MGVKKETGKSQSLKFIQLISIGYDTVSVSDNSKHA